MANYLERNFNVGVPFKCSRYTTLICALMSNIKFYYQPQLILGITQLHPKKNSI